MHDHRLEALIKPVVVSLGCELWGVEHLSPGEGGRLIVYIEKEEGVDVDDCARVSRQLSHVLDVEDPVDGKYTLEVSSPGLDRRLYTLSQFESWAGSQIRVRLRTPYEGQRKFSGVLCGVEDEDVVLRDGDEELLLPFIEIERAQVVPSF